ncbi:MAG: acyl-CoA thioesterase [Ignavibacteriae bacterium]|nr:acyl-CoA thioesterase [Ignavibacteriota bacterium]
MDRSKFKHTTQIKVRNYEVDWQGIVHNTVYLLYFEVGRVEYLKHIGVKVDINTIQGESKVVLVRNEINYKSPARFDELLTIYTRISFIKNTSFAFEAFLEEDLTKRLIAENMAIHVWLDSSTGIATTVDEKFKALVRKFEGDTVAILNNLKYS